MWNSFSYSGVVIDALSDVWDEVVINIPAEVLNSDFMVVPLAGGMIRFGVDMFTEVCMIVVLGAVSTLEVGVSASYAIDLRVGVIINVLADTVIGVAPGIGVDMLDDVDANMWAAAMTAVESILMLASSEEALLFGWEACTC